MSCLSHLLSQLANDDAELRRFLADSESWIATHGSSLPASDRTELQLVAKDAAAFLEARCRQRLDRSPETRFVQGSDLGRRHFMVRAVSSVLAAPIAAAFALAPDTHSRKSAMGTVVGGTDSCSDSGTRCFDGSCENDTCGDTEGCHDSNCTNTVACADTDVCGDNGCSNTKNCSDSTCTDAPSCENQTSCGDVNCSDVGCNNDGVCANNDCTDDGCQNQTCLDKGSCTDKGSCSDVVLCSK